MAANILVTGATGTIGQALVKTLRERDVSFVAGVRNPAQAREKLAPDAPLAAFDFSRPETFESATQGVDRVFLLGPPMVPGLADLLRPFIEFLKRKGIQRVVYLAALGLEAIPELPLHQQTIARLEREGFDYTVLKPSFFAQNFKNYEWENITQRGVTFAVAGKGKAGFIDAADIANVAAVVLTTQGHAKKMYDLTGPELLSYYEAADLLTEVTGKKIVYPEPSESDFRQALQAAGAPDFAVSYMLNVYRLISEGHVGYLTNDVEKLTGKKPTSLKTVLSANFASMTS
jgi:uncharacterized protein YbjT (DUF2867 family)